LGIEENPGTDPPYSRRGKMARFIIITSALLMLLPCVVWGKVGGGDIVFHPTGAKNVQYSHELHVAKIGLKCNNCHSQIYFMAIDANKKSSMAEMEKGRSCGTCHNGKKAFDVKGTNCSRCHQ
jgi:c(7)-type cytochrome triheme protein